MNKFNASEIFQFAINIEINGEKFYRDAAEKTEDTEIKQVFLRLADDEKEHKKIFEDILSNFADYNPAESYPEEYFAYLKAFVNNTIFSKDKLDAELAEVNDTLSAIDFAIRRESESILYYHEIKSVVPKEQADLINKIIEEERRHYLTIGRVRSLFI